MVLKPSLRQWIPKSPPGGCPFSVLKPTFHFLKGQKVDMVQTKPPLFFPGISEGVLYSTRWRPTESYVCLGDIEFDMCFTIVNRCCDTSKSESYDSMRVSIVEKWKKGDPGGEKCCFA